MTVVLWTAATRQRAISFSLFNTIGKFVATHDKCLSCYTWIISLYPL